MSVVVWEDTSIGGLVVTFLGVIVKKGCGCKRKECISRLRRDRRDIFAEYVTGAMILGKGIRGYDLLTT